MSAAPIPTPIRLTDDELEQSLLDATIEDSPAWRMVHDVPQCCRCGRNVVLLPGPLGVRPFDLLEFGPKGKGPMGEVTAAPHRCDRGNALQPIGGRDE